jgi:hypothetical protein
MRMFLEHSQTERRYEIVAVSDDKSKITLKGEHGTFEEDYDKDKFKRLGYKLVRA